MNGHGDTDEIDGSFYFVDEEKKRVYLLNDIVEPIRKCVNLELRRAKNILH